jgi:hypothetical protein
VNEAQRRVGELELEQRKARRKVDRMRAPLQDYWRAVAAGEREPDGDHERHLIEQVREAEASVSLRPVLAHGGVVELVAVDEKVEAQRAGAREVVQARQAELVAYVREHFDDLCLEALAVAERAGEEVREVLEAASKASAAWQSATGAWGRVCRLADRVDLLDELPENPLREVPPPFRTPGMPAPASLVGERETT